MNFLGHAYLSGNEPEILYGNFIGDAVKGSHYKKYPETIAKGILLHRKIDFFIDSYQGFNEFKQQLYPLASKMTPVVIDLWVDHMLACHWASYHAESLLNYSGWVYDTVDTFAPHPEKVNHFLPHMKEHNWLYQYKNEDGFKWALVNIARRIKFPLSLIDAADYCIANKSAFEPTFKTYIKKAERYAQDYLNHS